MKQQLVATIRREVLWEPGMRVAVAVSGGMDSMVLLDVLVATRGLHRAELSVVHVDHGQHPDSGQWASSVREVVEYHGLQLHHVEAALTPGCSEASARSARFAAFGRLPVDRVALGHHRRDQLETVFINLLRGTGGTGLRGMTWRRGRFVRPLLATDPRAMKTWAVEHEVSFTSDPSNDSPRFLRNRIRREVVPLLETLRPGIEASVARSATLAAEDDACLEALAAELPLTLTALQSAPPALVRRRVRGLVDGGANAQIDAVLDVIRRGRGEVQLGPDRRIVARHHRLVLEGDLGGQAG